MEHNADLRTGTGFQELFQILQTLVEIPQTCTKIVFLCKGQQLGSQLRAATNAILRLADVGTQLLRVA